MDRLIALALRRRIVIVVFSLALLVAGVFALPKLSVDAFPDVTNIQVVIATRVPGSAPEDVERLITIPLEIVMTGLPGLLEALRSVSSQTFIWTSRSPYPFQRIGCTTRYKRRS